MSIDWKSALNNFSDPDKAEELAAQAAKYAKLREEREDRERQEDQALRRKNFIDAYNRKVGLKHARCRLSNFTSRPGSEAVERRCLQAQEDLKAGKPAKGMLWLGGVGAGKDHLMCSLLQVAYCQCLTIRRDEGEDFAGLLRDQIKSNQTEADFIEQFTDPDIWAISDPDGQRGEMTEFHSGWLLRIINRRDDLGKPTWVTLNAVIPQEAQQRVGARVMDRLIDGGVVMWCLWPSFRKPGEPVIGGQR